jgi:hypothetical protein
MKIVGLAIVRTGPDLNEPIPLSVANDLSSFGFFQRQVRRSCRGMTDRREYGASADSVALRVGRMLLSL